MPKPLHPWTQPKVLDHSETSTHTPDGQGILPGMPRQEGVPRSGIDPSHPLYHQRGNPHVWGALAVPGNHNPFLTHVFDRDDQDSSSWEGRAQDEDWEHSHWAHLGNVVRHVRKQISGSYPCISIPPTALHRVVEEGRFKSQFESQSSKGLLSHGVRAHIEHEHFGYPSGVPSEPDDDHYDPDDDHDGDEAHAQHSAYARPIYGFLARRPMVNTLTSHYGAHTVVLKKGAVWHRTSATIGDSLDASPRVSAQPVQNFTEHGMDHYLHPIGEYGDARHPDPRDAHKALSGWGRYHPDHFDAYTEAQYHGGVSRHDIHYVVLRDHRYGETPLPMTKALLDHHKIPWVHVESRLADKPYWVVDHRHHEALRLLQANLEQAEAARMTGQIVATRGDGIFLIALPDRRGQIADTGNGVLYPIQGLDSILARGYWEKVSGIDVEDVLALVRPQ